MAKRQVRSGRRDASQNRRRMQFELLEDRRVLHGHLTNDYLIYDVNLDLRVSPIDALQVINQLTRSSNGDNSIRDGFFPDVNGDSNVSPVDALVILNRLARSEDVIASRLVNDTAPGGDFNYDRVTSDYSIEALVEPAGRSLELRIDSSDVTDFVDVSAFLDGGRLSISAAELDTLLPSPLVDGSHEIDLRFADDDQFERFTITVDREPPQVFLDDPDGILRRQEHPITLNADEAFNSSAISPESITLTDRSGTQIDVSSVAADGNRIDLELTSNLENSEYTISFSQPFADVAGNESLADDILFSVSQPTSVRELSPADGEQMVSLTRETIVHFDQPVLAETVNSDSFYLTAAGEPVAGVIRVSSTRKFATYFYDQPLPAATSVQVVVDGQEIQGVDGELLDADQDGEPGGRSITEFQTLPITLIPETSVFGFVYDSYNVNPDGSDIPIVGATIHLDAFPEIRAVTDENGFFELGLQDMNQDGRADGLPTPDFFVHIDGSTAINAPNGTKYATLGKPFHSIPGQRVQLEMAGESFDIYLPPMAASDVMELNPDDDTVVGFGAASQQEIREMFADDPDLAQRIIDATQVTYPAGSAMDQDSNPATRATIIPVNPDRLPAPLPSGIDPSLVISVQAGTEAGFNLAGGSTNFDVPAPISFPNLDGLAQGEQTSILSFNHDAGRWDIAGTATVSDNGMTIVSDVGSGIQAPGWLTWEELVNVTVDFVGPKPSAQEAIFTLTVALVKSKTEVLKELLDLKLNDLEEVVLGAIGLVNSISTALVDRNISLSEATTLAGDFAELFKLLNEKTNITKFLDVKDQGVAIASLLVQLIGYDPPCSSSAQGNTTGDYAVAASLCMENIVATADTYVTGLSQFRNAASGIVNRLFAIPDGLPLPPTAVIQRSDSGTAVFATEGELIINPETGGPFEVDFAELAISEFSEGELQEIEAALSDPGFEHAKEAFAVGLENDPLKDIQNAIVLIEKAIDATSQPISNGIAVLGNIKKRLGSNGSASALLRANTSFSGVGVDFETGNSEAFSFNTGAPGTTLSLGTKTVGEIDSIDLDEDDLGAIAENAVGTSDQNIDTDGDGVQDLTELRRGLDPLGGRFFPTGVISNLSIPGESNAITIGNNLLGIDRQLAFLATGSRGMAVVDIARFDQPILMSELDLPGDSVDIAEDSRTGRVIVAAKEGGLHFVNVRDLGNASLFRTIRIHADAVVSIEGVVVAADGAKLLAYDPLTGEEITQMVIPGAGNVTDLVQYQGRLFALDNARNLHLIDFQRLQFEMRGTLTVPDGPGGLSVLGDLAYIGTEPGFATIDVSDPDSPALLSDSDIASGFSAPGQHIAANGSGLALAAGLAGTGAANSPRIGLVDISAPEQTDQYLTQFALPASPNDVAIASGLGFVTTSSGLSVVNYLSFDNQALPPQVSMTLPSGNDVVEGTLVPVIAEITDDVQVSEVELLIDGRVAERDFSPPFELSFPVPSLSLGSDQISVQVRATDTGGNATVTETQELNIIKDSSAPELIYHSPSSNQPGFRVDSITLRFDEPIDTSLLSIDHFMLTHLGDDQQLGTGDDTAIELSRLEEAGRSRIMVRLPRELDEGRYSFTVEPGMIRDLGGNELASQISFMFNNFDIDSQNAMAWIADNDGNWNDPGNWSTGAIPDENDYVVIDRVESNPVITMATGNNLIRGLYSTEPFVLSGGTLQVAESSSVMSDFTMTGGTLRVESRNAVFTASSGTAIVSGGNINISSNAIVELPELTLLTDTSVLLNGRGRLEVPSAENVDGSRFQLSGGAVLALDNVQTYDGSATVSNGTNLWFSVAGLGSRLSFPALTSIDTSFSTRTGVGGTAQVFEATDGGVLDLSSVQTIQGGGSTRGGVATYTFRSDARSRLLLDSLSRIAGERHGVRLNLELEDVKLAQLSEADQFVLQIGDGQTWELPLLTRFENSSLAIQGSGRLNVPTLESLNRSTVSLMAGAQFTLPESVTAYEATGSIPSSEKILFSVNGPGSRLAFPGLKSIDGTYSGFAGNVLQLVEATDGGVIDLNQVTTIRGGGSATGGGGPLEFRSDSISEIQLGSLQTSEGVNGGLLFRMMNSSLEIPNLLTADQTTIHVQDGQRVSMPSLTEYTSGNVVVTGSGSLLVDNLSNIDRSSIAVVDGAKFSLPHAVTTYDSSGSFPGGRTVLFSADGVGSELRFPALRSITSNFTTFVGGVEQSVSASNGGIVDLNSVEEIVGGGRALGGGGPFILESTAAGQIQLDSLRTLTGVHQGVVLDISNAQIEFPELRTMENTAWGIQQGQIINVPALEALITSRLEVVGSGRLNASMLARIDGSTISAIDGAVLEFPGIVTLANSSSASLNLEADGTGSRINFTQVQTIGNTENVQATLNIQVVNGGQIAFEVLTEIVAPFDANTNGLTVSIFGTGDGSQLLMPDLLNFSGMNDESNRSLIKLHDFALLLLDEEATLDPDIEVTLETGARIVDSL